MFESDTAEVDSTDIDPRTRRAFERVATVTHTDGTTIYDDETPTIVSVHSGNSGREHRVDVREGRCTCRDHLKRGSRCYHIRRAEFALAVEPVHRDTLAAVDVHRNFAANAPGPVVITSDGGVVGGSSSADQTEETDETSDRSRVPVAGGVLVYEQRDPGRELVDFESVENGDRLADALAARGLDRGDALHLPELDETEGSR
jgi:hypothetical protein